MRKLCASTVLVLVWLAGCSTYPREPAVDDPAYLDQRVVITQICAVHGFEPDLVEIETASIIPNEGGGNSMGGGGHRATAETKVGQPFYEIEMKRQIDLAAVIVSDDLDNDFVFFLHHAPLGDRWTDWEDAQSQNPHGQHMAARIIDAAAGQKPVLRMPMLHTFRARFRTIRRRDYGMPLGITEDVPAC